MKEPTALQRLDNLMARLVDADQSGAAIAADEIAHELGRIRSQLTKGTPVRRYGGGKMHFRCDVCGTISHADGRPERCPECGADRLMQVDLEQADVDAGPG